MLRWPGASIPRACLLALILWSLAAPSLATWLIVGDSASDIVGQTSDIVGQTSDTVGQTVGETVGESGSEPVADTRRSAAETPRPAADTRGPAAEALVVLAGSAVYLERTAHAAQLYHAGLAPKVLLTNDGQRSRWSRADGRNPLFYERAFEALLRHGVPRSRIEVLPERVSSTFDEAVRLRRYACTTGLHSLMIVTSGYHSRRARWTLRAVLPPSVTLLTSPAPVGALSGGNPETVSPSPMLWWLQPRGWQMVAGEYVKAAYYWMTYPVVRGRGAAQPC